MPDNERIPSAAIAEWMTQGKGELSWSPSRSLSASLRTHQYWKSHGAMGSYFAGLRSVILTLLCILNVGARTKIIHPISIGDYAVSGDNAVVLSDVPANAVAEGIPARVILRADRGAS